MIIKFYNDTFNVKEIPQYEEIRHANGAVCDCGHAHYLNHDTFSVVGFCSTKIGYMPVFECKKCFGKYRHHIQTTGRYDLEDFKRDLGLLMHLQAHP